MVDKLDSALQLSEEILAGVETESLSTSAVALRCLRLARLLSDAPSIEWFQCETSGYPQTPEGHIDSKAFEIACAHGREIFPLKDGKRYIFVELADELEAMIETTKKAIGTLTTSGVSVGGDMALLAMEGLSRSVSAQTDALLQTVNQSQRRLATLRGKYYEYALLVNLELKFSQKAEEVFRAYRLSVDKQLATLAPEALKKLDAAYERLSSHNPESWAQAVTSCRRVLQEVSDALFRSPRDKQYVTKSGKILDVSGDRYLNRLYATIDMIASSSTARKFVGSNVMYVVDLVENLHDMLNRGVHDLEGRLTYDDARASILHTYMLLGDVVTLVLNESKAH